MSEHAEFPAVPGMIQWEREVRGYNRAQVDEYVAMQSGQIRELENKLRQGLSEIERLRRELSEARDAGGRPAHGAQLGLVSYTGGHFMGAQLGWAFNYAKEVTGLQLGIVNYAERLNKGLQIGLVNIAKNGFLPVFVIFNFNFS